MKSTFLQVMGIICIVFGGISVLMSLIGFGGYIASGLTVYGILEAVGNLLIVVGGINGVVYCADQSKALRCVVLGIAMIAVKIIANIVYNSSAYVLSFAGLGTQITSAFTISIPVIPIIYFIAAFLFLRKK